MEYRKVFLLSVVVFLSACAGKNVEQPVTVEFEPVESESPIPIPFEAGVGVEREIKLSDIADSVQYVPLETNDKRLFGEVLDSTAQLEVLGKIILPVQSEHRFAGLR